MSAVASVVGAGVAVWGAWVLLQRQAAIARRRIGKPLGEEALDADRVWRRGYDAPPIELLIVGDSIAAGLGAEHRKETLGGRLAKGLARCGCGPRPSWEPSRRCSRVSSTTCPRTTALTSPS